MKKMPNPTNIEYDINDINNLNPHLVDEALAEYGLDSKRIISISTGKAGAALLNDSDYKDKIKIDPTLDPFFDKIGDNPLTNGYRNSSYTIIVINSDGVMRFTPKK